MPSLDDQTHVGPLGDSPSHRLPCYVIVVLALPFIFIVLPFVLFVRWINKLRHSGVDEEDWLYDFVPEWLYDLLTGDVLLGMYLGLGAGIWAVSVKAVEGSESSDLIGLAEAAVGPLGVTLAAMALLIAFLNDRTEEHIRENEGGVAVFFRPFRITAWVSAAAILFCVVGAIDATTVTTNHTGAVITNPGPTWLAAALYGASVWLFVWAVVGVAQLVWEHLPRLGPRPRGDSKDIGPIRRRFPTGSRYDWCPWMISRRVGALPFDQRTEAHYAVPSSSIQG